MIGAWRLRAIPVGILGLLFIGYHAMSRGFAHLGVAPLFVGELCFGTLLLVTPFAFTSTWIRSLIRPTALTPIAWLTYLFLLFGILETLRGMGAGYSKSVAIKCLVFNIYPLFFFPAVWVGVQHPHFMARIMQVCAWCVGCYGVIYILVLSPLGLTEKVEMREEVGMFGAPWGSSVMLVGLLAFTPALSQAFVPLMLNLFVLLAMQIRATWLAVAIGVPCWAFFAGQLSRLAQFLFILGVVFAVGFALDVRMPSPTTRGNKEWGGHEFSARHLVARAIAAVDEETAAAIVPEMAEFYAGTVSWRTEWWSELWKMVHASPVHALIGPGYGYPIWSLHPEDLQEEELRTPHNVFMYALSYTGWVGVGLFVVFQLEMLRVLWCAYRTTGQPFGMIHWAMVLAWATFDNYFETPFGAIPFYILCGLAAAPVLAAEAQPEPNAS